MSILESHEQKTINFWLLIDNGFITYKWVIHELINNVYLELVRRTWCHLYTVLVHFL